MADRSGRQCVIVDGARTPFLRVGGDGRQLDLLDLADVATSELLRRTKLDPSLIGALVYGNVARPLAYSNLARELVLAVGLPKRTPAYTVSAACVSSCQAITNLADQIELGRVDAGIAGGAESPSNVPISFRARLNRAIVAAHEARSLGGRLRSFAGITPIDLVPEIPAVREPSTGLSLGKSAERMAQLNGVSRSDQDAFALTSHQRATAAWTSNRLLSEVVPLSLSGRRGGVIQRDQHVRTDASLERLSALKPAFARTGGSVTVGNSSPLADGAASVLLMAERLARAGGYPIKARIRGYAYCAVAPKPQLLIGPAYAIPLALDRAGVTLGDMGLVELHEAFAAQVLSTLGQLESSTFAHDELNRAQAVGAIDPARLNVNGGSIAFGGPFGATGARLVLMLANEMERRDVELGLAAVCGAGGLGCALVLERG